MKSTFLKILFLIISLLSVIACDEEKLLREENQDSLDNDLLIKNLTDLEARLLVNGTYTNLQTTGLYARFGYFLFDHMADEVIVSTDSNNAQLNQIQTLTLTSLSDSVKLFYEACYKAIFKANTAISIFKNTTSSKIDEDDLKFREAEARFMRAFYYSLLVSRFGGVPLQDENLSEDNIPRSSERQVYDFIIEDLKFAAENLNPKGSSETGRPTQGAAYAFLGKAYLFSIPMEQVTQDQEKYQLAYDAFDKVEGYSLVPEYLDNFTESNEWNEESLFEVGFIDKSASANAWGLDGTGDDDTSFQGADYSGWGNSRPTKKMIEAYEGDGAIISRQDNSTQPADNTTEIRVRVEDRDRVDPRLYYSWWTTGQPFGTSNWEWGNVPDRKEYERTSVYGTPAAGSTCSRKNSLFNTRDFQITAESGVNYRVLRYADVILMKAEAALFKDGSNTLANKQEVIDLLNIIRQRPSVNMAIYGSAETNNNGYRVDTVEQLFAAIKHERQVELALEGKRLVDLYRWGDDIKELSDVKTTYTRATGRYMPIPQVQLDSNDKIDPRNPAPDL